MSTHEAGGVVGHDLDQPDAEKGARHTRLLDALSAALALVGTADAVYLTAKHISGGSVRCVGTSGCDSVLMSPYATLPGDVPLAALGAVAYFTAFALATLSVFSYARTATFLRVLVGVMFAFTLWLFYLQAVVLGAFCSYCLLSAGVTTALLVIQLARRFLAPKSA